MAIVQISKIQTRSGNLVDLPQLDNGEFGWATDENRLFIGRTGSTFSSENIEVLTSYSNISFSQIDGSDGGNFNITTPTNGQPLVYVQNTNTWENYKGQSSQLNGGKLQLGNVANINIGGGAIGYVLETDGLGNLTWTPKGTLYTPIKALSNANPIVMTVANTTPYTSGQEITISGVLGTNANTIVNGQNFYITLANDFPTSGNVKLYTDPSRTVGANGVPLTATANTGLATAVIAGGGGGTGAAGGTAGQVQFNDGGILAGNTGFTFTKGTGALAVIGNVTSANVSVTGSVTSPVLISNIATGTAPLTVTSTTRVANLNVAYANVSDYTNITTATTGNYYPVLTNTLTGNVAEFANSVLVFNVATGALTSTLFTGTLTTNAQPNITSVGTLTSLAVTGNTTSGNFIGVFANGTSNISIPASAGNINFGVAGNANVLTVTGAGINVAGTINATGNITGNLFGPLANGNSNVRIATANGNVTISAVGNANILTVTGTGVNVAGTLNTTGNALIGNLNTSGIIIANTQLQANVATGTAPLVVLSSTQVPNLYASRANVSDTSTFTALTTGTYYVPLISGTAAANYAFGSNTAYSVNVANGALSATTFVGNLSGQATSATTAGTVTTAAQPNITSVGTLTGLGVNGTLTAVNITANSGLITGTLATNAQPNITSVGTLTSLAITGNVSPGGIKTDNYYYANGVQISFAGAYSNSNVAAYLPTFTGTVGATTLTTGANTTGGNITGNWTLTAGSRLNATYADLAEYYEADAIYEPGTVLEFGGDKEVTLASDETMRVAGVVSTDPAYVMNSTCPGIATPIALQGRVPCKVRGVIRKGDMMVSGGDGYARPTTSPKLGTIIGKALENFSGAYGVIEIAVGRL